MMAQLRQVRQTLEPPERRRFVLLAVADAAMAVLDLAFLAALLAIVNYLLRPSSGSMPALSVAKLPWAVGLFFLLFILKNALGVAVARAAHAFAGKVALRLSERALISCQQLPHADWVNTDSSVFIRKVNFHPMEFAHYLLLGSQQLLTQAWLIALAIGAILWFDAGLFLLLLAVLLPPAILLVLGIRRQTTGVKNAIRTGNEQSLQCLSEALDGLPETKVYARQRFFRERFVAARRQFSAAYFRSISMQQLPGRAIETCAVLGLLVLLVVATSSGTGSAGLLLQAGAFLAAAYKVIPGLVKMVNLYGQIRTWSFTLNTGNVSDQPPSPPQRMDHIKAEGIGFSFGRKRLFDNISFEAGRGDFIVLTGASGIGKTTLLQLLLGFHEPASGNLLVNGKRVTPKNAGSWWGSVSYVRQQPFLMHDTLARNITMEHQTLYPARLQHALAVAGLNHLCADADKAADMLVMEKGRNLSGGQRQRVAFARALYQESDLYLLDEPFSELDAGSEKKMLQELEALAASGKIVILITHHPENLPASATIVNLHATHTTNTGADYARLRGVGS
jgi:ABC-type transport system involved in cytochrome bd biosynthesis fused ATPase/permease subunit